jgi:hypothetical protein
MMIDRWELVYALRLPLPTVLLNEWTRMHFRTKKRYMEKLGWMVIAANGGCAIRTAWASSRMTPRTS